MSTAMNTAAESEPTLVKRSVRLLRVSTSAQTDTDYDQERQEGNSIDTQRKETVGKEKRLGTVNVGEYVEPGYSGQSIEKRPFFKEMMKRIVEQRDVDYVVIYMRSRVFRNYVEAAIVKRQLEQLGVKIISAKEDFGEGYMAEAMEAVTDVFNWLQVKISGQDIKTKMANKARNGGTIGRAKVGYLNQKLLIDGHKVNTIVLDPERAHYIRTAFELFATGDETVATLHEKITLAGLRMPGNAKRPSGPISHEQLRLVLRDRYYLGYVAYDGIEYPGRHEPLTDQDTFDKVQRVLDTHTGSGTRERSHHHYLKGLLWCARCRRRFIVQRAVGNGGEYFYWLCRGRQTGTCDMAYIPIDVLEEAVARHYGNVLTLDPASIEKVARAVDAAVADNREIPTELREQYDKRLEALDRKEGYFLDLAAEEGWPKDKLRAKIEAVRHEAAGIKQTIERADQRQELGRQIIHDALALLEDPHIAYEHGNELVRATLNKAFFTRIYIDGKKIAEHELQEPFDTLLGARHEHEIAPTGSRGEQATRNAGAPKDPGADDREPSAVTQPLTLRVNGWSNAAMVDDTGIEPVTSSVSGKRSPAELIVRDEALPFTAPLPRLPVWALRSFRTSRADDGI
jgi:site-specific DNA recombinase